MLKLFSLMLAFVLWGLLATVYASDRTGDDGSGYETGASSGDGQASKGLSSMHELPVIPQEGSGTTVLSNQQYRIGPSDELDIEVFQAADLSGVERVNARGYINMPLIGLIKVAGLTQDEAEALIAAELQKDYMQNPHVNIDIKEFVSQQVTVLGSVQKPGVYPLKGPTTLMQAIALAGGAQSIADENEVVVFRTNEKGEVMGYFVNLVEIQEGNKVDPKIVGNDRIVVPKSGSRAAIKGVTDTLRGFIGFGTL